ncbi:hypothetical protein TanjilG_16877 [Lupinus angustifolius]|nr:hypothetical protein TanjilG_16877 [Lupinus angustifolius]
MDNDLVPAEDRSTLSFLDSSSDFMFCITNGLSQNLFSADELFWNITKAQLNHPKFKIPD